MGKNAAESVKGAVMGKDKMKKEVSTDEKTGMPVFDPQTGLAKTHDVESGRHSGLLGNTKDLKADAKQSFKDGYTEHQQH